MELTIAQIKAMLSQANAQELAVMERSLGADTRKGVQTALAQAKRRCAAVEKEAARLTHLYEFERGFAVNESSIIVGLDEVGRGPIAGPLAVGAVVLGSVPIEGLNDSKQVKESNRKRIAEVIRQTARAQAVILVEPTVIDKIGMAQALRQAFSEAIATIDQQLEGVDVVLIDGNPLHIDPREKNVVKGDTNCASIAAASILAKVTRDNLMEAYDQQYPGYGFSSHKGYGSQEHIAALKTLGPCPLHRLSFCSSFLQPTLFDL